MKMRNLMKELSHYESKKVMKINDLMMLIKEMPNLGKRKIAINEVSFGYSFSSTQCTQTENDLPAISKTSRQSRRSSPTSFVFGGSFSSRVFKRIISQKKKYIHPQQSYRSHRPYFTYWVTFVQILVCAVSLIVYGYAPFTSSQSVSEYHSFSKNSEFVYRIMRRSLNNKDLI